MQLYVDDPVVVAAGTTQQNDVAFDVVVCWWLALGVALAWSKGTRSENQHRWIGAEFTHEWREDRFCAVVRVPDAFAEDLWSRLGDLTRGKGHVTEATLDTLLGKAGRLAYVLPSTRPFVAALWAARAASQARSSSGNRRDAPPGCFPCARFAAAATWLRILLKPPPSSPAFLPLEQVVTTSSAKTDSQNFSVECDASPWGGGAILFQRGVAKEWFATTWSQECAEYLSAPLGLPEGQTTWEYLIVYLVLLSWGSRCRATGLAIAGDNLSSLAGSLNLKGKGGLHKITREISWRKTRYAWKFSAGHLPTELNTAADALSRLAAPSGADQKQIPEQLLSVRRGTVPEEKSWWAFAG